jgi:hypothetical protein
MVCESSINPSTKSIISEALIGAVIFMVSFLAVSVGGTKANTLRLIPSIRVFRQVS